MPGATVFIYTVGAADFVIGFFYMKTICLMLLLVVLCADGFGQSDLQRMFDTDRNFSRAAAEKGVKPAFLEFLSADSIIFRPDPVNGRAFWNARDEPATARLIRKPAYADIASSGMLGYTTGYWELRPKGKQDSMTEFGQYVTIWEKRQDGTFRASVDINIKHDKIEFIEPKGFFPTGISKETNERRWSVADASMNFLRLSMRNEGVKGAYKKFAANDVRLLREGSPPITGKKNVIEETENYVSSSFPEKMASLQSADLAYVWNPCEFADSNEGTEKGSCLQIWKLRGKKWLIVLGVFAPVPNEKRPELKIKK